MIDTRTRDIDAMSELTKAAEAALISVRQPRARTRAPRRPKDPTAARRSRNYRARKRGELSTVTVAPETTVTLMPPERPRASRPTLLVTTVTLLGLATAAVGLWLNAAFLFAFGQTSQAGIVLAVIGLVTDAFTLVLPAVTAGLWQRGRYALATIAVAVYLVAVTMTGLASLGFASGNIGDAVTGRSAATSERVTLASDIAALRTERAALSALGFASTTAAAVTAATVARDQECGKVGPNCRARVAELNAVLKDRAATERAAELDGKIKDATAKLARLPAIGAADPQVEAAVKLVAWATRGTLTPGAADVEMLRLLGVALMPILGGLLIAFAMGLAQPARAR